jgi:hypothetical protein
MCHSAGGTVRAFIGLGLDFARYLCHSIGQHHLAAGPSPAHSKALHLTAIPLRSIAASELYRYGREKQYRGLVIWINFRVLIKTLSLLLA